MRNERTKCITTPVDDRFDLHNFNATGCPDLPGRSWRNARNGNYRVYFLLCSGRIYVCVISLPTLRWSRAHRLTQIDGFATTFSPRILATQTFCWDIGVYGTNGRKLGRSLFTSGGFRFSRFYVFLVIYAHIDRCGNISLHPNKCIHHPDGYRLVYNACVILGKIREEKN